jgi:hypothetical protein
MKKMHKSHDETIPGVFHTLENPVAADLIHYYKA